MLKCRVNTHLCTEIMSDGDNTGLGRCHGIRAIPRENSVLTRDVPISDYSTIILLEFQCLKFCVTNYHNPGFSHYH